MATCEFRDECWAARDERTLGAAVMDQKAAKRARIRHRLPSTTRPHACGFESTTLWFCPKYRRWKSAMGEESPAETANTGGSVVDMTMKAAREPLPLNAIPNRELNQFVFGYDMTEGTT